MSLFGIQPGERRVLLPALALAFASVGAFALSTIASDTLFVSAFDLGAVSRFYLVATLARGSFALLYGAAASRMTLPRLDGAVLAITAVVMVVAGSVVGQASKPVLYGVCVLLAFSPSLLPLIAFNTATACLIPARPSVWCRWSERRARSGALQSALRLVFWCTLLGQAAC